MYTHSRQLRSGGGGAVEQMAQQQRYLLITIITARRPNKACALLKGTHVKLFQTHKPKMWKTSTSACNTSHAKGNIFTPREAVKTLRAMKGKQEGMSVLYLFYL